MIILAIDTSMARCSAAVLDGGAVLASARADMERGHAEALAPMVRDVLARAAMSPKDLQRVAVTIGPGTFTGVRIGLAFARGVGLSRHLPVFGIDSLRAIVANEHEVDRPLMVASQACNNEVYAAIFAGDRSPIHPPTILPVETAGHVAPPGARVLGTAAELVIAASGRTDLIRSGAGDLPVAARFGHLAGQADPPSTMPAPLYLRPPDAKPQVQAGSRLITFQPVGPEAGAVLSALHARAFDRPWTTEAFAALLATPGAAATIAVRDGTPVGLVVSRQAADEAEIITIGTVPEGRRQGVGLSLLRHHAGDLAAAGARAIFLEVAQSNAAAIALYRAAGFAEAGRRRGYYERAGGLREDALLQRLDIRP